MTPRVARLLLISLMAGACSATPNRDPTGERFPAVRGTSLESTPVALPEDLAGQPAILLVGYVQDAQFDLDRWILGLAQAGTPGPILELPTIDGMATLFSGSIDEGMRSGIPDEDWASVVTVYGDGADAIVRFTGDEHPRNGRILLVDGDGRVVWFHDRGYSARHVLELDAAVRAILSASEAAALD